MQKNFDCSKEITAEIGILDVSKGGFSLCGKDTGWAKGEQVFGRGGQSKRDNGMYKLFGGSQQVLF